VTKLGVIVIGVFLVSGLGFVVAFLLGARSVGNWFAVPALVFVAVLWLFMTLQARAGI
jgi:hypothetical protein